VPVRNRLAIHARVVAVSCLMRRAGFTFGGSPFRRRFSSAPPPQSLSEAQKPFHSGDEVGHRRFDDEMEMISHQAIGMDLGGEDVRAIWEDNHSIFDFSGDAPLRLVFYFFALIRGMPGQPLARR
jgi:hypothetical protein